MPKSNYSLFQYSLNGETVYSAIHIYDLGTFLRQHPDAKFIKHY